MDHLRDEITIAGGIGECPLTGDGRVAGGARAGYGVDWLESAIAIAG